MHYNYSILKKLMDLEDGCISVTIPRTDSQISNRFFSRPFTVGLT